MRRAPSGVSRYGPHRPEDAPELPEPLAIQRERLNTLAWWRPELDQAPERFSDLEDAETPHVPDPRDKGRAARALIRHIVHDQAR